MTDDAAQSHPRGMIARARWAAENTPDSRNRAVDLYRAIAICFVVLGHWFLVAVVFRDGQPELTILLAEQPWTQYLTWLFQVMPVFFFVGGYSNALSWASARRDPERQRTWAATRLARLLKPTVPLILVYAAAAFIAYRSGLDRELIASATKAALVPVWFLAVYIMITMAVPLTKRVWDALGLWSVVLLAAGAVTVDATAFGLDQGWLRWANYGFVWLAVHQLGYWWCDTRRTTPLALALVALGVVSTWALISILGYPISMVSVPGEEISNTRPPTIAMLTIGATQIGVILLLERPMQAFLQRTGPWSAVIIVSQMIMTVYLWHMTSLLILIGLSWLAGGIGFLTEPGSGAWWAARPLALLALAAVTVPLVLTFMRFESASKAPSRDLPGPWPAFLGALAACGGLVMMALGGVGAGGATGVNWWAVILVVGGVILATTPLASRFQLRR